MPALAPDLCRRLLADEPVARLATVTPEGDPHVVPVCFAIVGVTIVSAVDAKPKTTRALGRLTNVRAHPKAALLVDFYADDWTRLWWVRVDATVTVVDEDAAAFDALMAKYAYYRDMTPAIGPYLVLQPERWSGWSYIARSE